MYKNSSVFSGGLVNSIIYLAPDRQVLIVVGHDNPDKSWMSMFESLQGSE